MLTEWDAKTHEFIGFSGSPGELPAWVDRECAAVTMAGLSRLDEPIILPVAAAEQLCRYGVLVRDADWDGEAFYFDGVYVSLYWDAP